MSELRLRPRYYFKAEESMAQLQAKIKFALAEANPLHLKYRSTKNHITVFFPPKEKHFWSPELDINFEKKGKNETFIRILISPSPSIWTFFMFIYTVGGLLISAGFAVGFSQYALKKSTWALFFIPAGAAIIALTYLAGQFGKYKAEKQLRELKDFFDAALPGVSSHTIQDRV